jgi:hypothetical protein
MEPLIIITGHYGSGKSEVAIQLALNLAAKHVVCLADLDIVNPYFRSREVKEQLNQLGIQVIGDTLNTTKGLDMPYLSPAIKGNLTQLQQTMILDCGGDDVGIRVLSQFQKEIKARNHSLWMVVNTYRPQTATVEQIMTMKDQLENESGLEITGYINNSNFLRQTTVEDLIASDHLLKQVSQLTNCPIVYVSGLEAVINQLPSEVSGERLALNLSLRSHWL